MSFNGSFNPSNQLYSADIVITTVGYYELSAYCYYGLSPNFTISPININIAVYGELYFLKKQIPKTTIKNKNKPPH